MALSGSMMCWKKVLRCGVASTFAFLFVACSASLPPKEKGALEVVNPPSMVVERIQKEPIADLKPPVVETQMKESVGSDPKSAEEGVKIGNVRVSQAMLDILYENPLRAPKVIAITKRAKQEASRKSKQRRGYPADASRHIYWSYHLTKAFGADFAKRFTDSHERLKGNTKNERLMDYHNNAFARQLVQQGVSEEELEEIVLQHPRVIRKSREVKHFKDLLR